MAKALVRVLVVDDFEPWRRFACATVQQRPEIQVVAEVSDGVEAVHKAQELQPDLILLDIGLPSLSGIEASRQIRELSPNSKILFVSENHDLEIVQAAFRAGACGYVVKSGAQRELLAAVEAVLQGGQFRSPGLNGHDLTGSPDGHKENPRCNKISQ